MDFKRIGIGVAVAIAIVIVGIVVFGTKTIDSDDLESKLAEQAAPSAGGAGAVDVSCPDDIEVEEGKVFDCEATINGRDQTIEVRLTDDEGTFVARLK